ncbi:MAG: DUF58 domain-containing protein [Gaiellaceae bacterium]
MKRTASPKLGAYAGLAALGLLAALVLGRPELAVLATPFALVLFTGLLAAREPEIRVALDLDRERAVEGEIVTITIDLHAGWPIERLELHVPLPDNLELVEGATPLTLRLAWDEERTIELQARCKRWGAHLVGELFLRAHDRLDLFGYEGTLDRRQPLKIYPRAEELRSLVTPLETQVFTGNQVARTKGEGIEFADLRRYAYGDSLRRINWRASARRSELWVNEMHPERNTDVIVFLDTFVEAREQDESTLDVAVRAAATLADRYLKRKDRVGLISFGGYLNWLLPGSGLVQLYRIVDSLLDTEIILSYAWKGVDVIPPRTLPPKALIFAITPLLDERAVTTLIDLRARGFDLAVLEVSPVAFASAATGEQEELAHRLWRLKRDALRARYQRFGVPVVEWHEGEPLEGALAEVGAFRRQARYARA